MMLRVCGSGWGVFDKWRGVTVITVQAGESMK